MKKIVSDVLRRLAYMLEEDTTPPEKEEAVRKTIHQTPIPVKETGRKMPVLKKTKDKNIVEIGTTQTVAPPKIKPPRRLGEGEKEWNADNKTQKMREYMRQYRGVGRDKETGNPKSTHIKKLPS